MSHYAIFSLGMITGFAISMFFVALGSAITEHSRMKQLRANQRAYKGGLKGYEADCAAYMLGGNV